MKRNPSIILSCLVFFASSGLTAHQKECKKAENSSQSNKKEIQCSLYASTLYERASDILRTTKLRKKMERAKQVANDKGIKVVLKAASKSGIDAQEVYAEAAQIADEKDDKITALILQYLSKDSIKTWIKKHPIIGAGIFVGLGALKIWSFKKIWNWWSAKPENTVDQSTNQNNAKTLAQNETSQEEPGNNQANQSNNDQQELNNNENVDRNTNHDQDGQEQNSGQQNDQNNNNAQNNNDEEDDQAVNTQNNNEQHEQAQQGQQTAVQSTVQVDDQSENRNQEHDSDLNKDEIEIEKVETKGDDTQPGDTFTQVSNELDDLLISLKTVPEKDALEKKVTEKTEPSVESIQPEQASGKVERQEDTDSVVEEAQEAGSDSDDDQNKSQPVDPIDRLINEQAIVVEGQNISAKKDDLTKNTEPKSQVDLGNLIDVQEDTEPVEQATEKTEQPDDFDGLEKLILTNENTMSHAPRKSGSFNLLHSDEETEPILNETKNSQNMSEDDQLKAKNRAQVHQQKLASKKKRRVNPGFQKKEEETVTNEPNNGKKAWVKKLEEEKKLVQEIKEGKMEGVSEVSLEPQVDSSEKKQPKSSESKQIQERKGRSLKREKKQKRSDSPMPSSVDDRKKK